MRVNDCPARASRELRPGDVVSLKVGDVRRTVRVRATLEHRLGAACVPEYAEDLTPPEEYARARSLREAPGGPRRDPGAGRPTKRDRRLLEAFLELPPPPEDPGPPPSAGLSPD